MQVLVVDCLSPKNHQALQPRVDGSGEAELVAAGIRHKPGDKARYATNGSNRPDDRSEVGLRYAGTRAYLFFPPARTDQPTSSRASHLPPQSVRLDNKS